MPSITFVPGTTVPATWLNDVNVATFTTIPTLAPLVSPSFTTPTLGVATATSVNKITFTQPASGATLTIANGKTLTANSSVTLAGTDGVTLTVGASGGTISGGGTNTGDQLTFKTIAVSGQSDIVADSITDTLTFVAGSHITLTTDAATDSLTIDAPAAGALTLLATITPSVAANVDFLTTFTSSYDNYLIIGEGLVPSAADSLLMRVAAAGTSDSGSNYYNSSTDGDYTLAGTSVTISGTTLNAGKGCGFTIMLQNANDATNLKTFQCAVVSHKNATPTYTNLRNMAAYVAANAISGVRFYWNGGANFTATGRIRVYGYANT